MKPKLKPCPKPSKRAEGLIAGLPDYIAAAQKRKPTALDILLDDYNHPRGLEEDARRELAAMRELAEADDAIDEMKFVGSMTDAIERRAKARDAYRKWKAEQENQS